MRCLPSYPRMPFACMTDGPSGWGAALGLAGTRSKGTRCVGLPARRGGCEGGDDRGLWEWREGAFPWVLWQRECQCVGVFCRGGTCGVWGVLCPRLVAWPVMLSSNDLLVSLSYPWCTVGGESRWGGSFGVGCGGHCDEVVCII